MTERSEGAQADEVSRDVEKEQELRNLFYDPMTGFQSRERLYQKAKDRGLKVSRREVKEWLETQETYTRHKPVVKRHKFQKTYVNDLADQIQLDLVDMSKFSHKNQGYRWILTGIEILSRYGFAVPVQRKDTSDMTEAVLNLLEDFKIGFGKYPNVVQFDDGKEFYSVGVRRLLEGKKIKYFSTKSDKKAAVVERFNRTLKTMMWKYFFKNQKYTWLNVLDKLVENYNNTKHRSIGMKPIEVNEDNEFEVWKKLFGGAKEFKAPEFKIGDSVRIHKYKSIFAKGYEPNFTSEVFKIIGVLKGDPNMYVLEDPEDKEPIIGKFYEQELSKINNG